MIIEMNMPTTDWQIGMNSVINKKNSIDRLKYPLYNVKNNATIRKIL